MFLRVGVEDGVRLLRKEREKKRKKFVIVKEKKIKRKMFFRKEKKKKKKKKEYNPWGSKQICMFFNKGGFCLGPRKARGRG